MKTHKFGTVALGILIGTLVGYEGAMFFVDEASVWAIVLSSILGGISAWIAVDPLNFGRGMKKAARMFGISFSKLFLDVVAFAGAVPGAIATLILLFGGYDYLLESGPWPPGLGTVVEPGSWTALATFLIQIYFVTFIFFGVCTVVVQAFAWLVNPDRDSPESLLGDDPDSNLARWFLGLSFITGPVMLAVGVVVGIAVLCWLFITNIHNILGALFRYALFAVFVFALLALLTVRYTISQRTLIAFAGAAICAPLTVITGSLLVNALVGALIGELIYQVLALRILHLSSKTQFIPPWV